MNNQLIKKEDISVFEKIRSFFRRLFSKKERDIISEEKQVNNINSFEENLRVKESNTNQKEKELKIFITEIEANPNIIENLSNDRLDKLISYYENITNTKRTRIEKLKSCIN